MKTFKNQIVRVQFSLVKFKLLSTLIYSKNYKIDL